MKTDASMFVKAVLALFNGAPYIDENCSAQFNAGDMLAKHGVFVTEAAQKALPSIGRYSAFIAAAHGYDLEKANAGLFDSFAGVKSASSTEFFINQVFHYFSVYSQNGGNDRDARGVDSSVVYIRPRELRLPEGEPIRIIVIDAISDEEIIGRTKDMLASGMALSEKTLDYLTEIVSRFKSLFSLSDTANKELRTRMIDLLGIMPDKAVDLIRYIVLKKTGASLIVHSKRFIETVMKAKDKFDSSQVLSAFAEQNGIEDIARQFNRHKKLWLAFRHDGPAAAKIINRARRLSVKLNRPAVIGVLDRIGDSTVTAEEVRKELAKATVFKKVSVVNSLLRRAGNPTSSLYTIRTGRSYAKEYGRKNFMTAERAAIIDMIIKSAAADLRPAVEGKHIRLPEDMNYAFPTSEKMFMGPIPSLSSLSLPENVIVGIHWLNTLAPNGKENRVDLDLHYTSEKIDVGWNIDFASESRRQVLFSGDMVNAPRPKGAAEVFFISDAVDEDFAALSVNKYTYGKDPVPFSVFFGKCEEENPNPKYLVSQRQICVNINGLEIEGHQMLIGFIESHKGGKTLHFIKTALGNSIVSSYDDNMKNALDAILSMLVTRLSLKHVLSLAGASFEPKDDGTWDIDLSLNALTADSFSFLTAKPKE